VLPLKELEERSVGEKVTGWDGEVLKGLEGLPGGWTWFAGHLPTAGRRKNRASLMKAS
jgi:hypothetical protein